MTIRPRFSTLHAMASYGAVLLAALYFLMPWQPDIGFGLDYAWAMVLNLVHEKQLQFGLDVLFTYGSWGFVEQGHYYPATRQLVLILNALIITLWATSVWLAVGHWFARPRWWRAMVLILLVVVSLLSTPWFSIVFTTGFMMAMVPCQLRLTRLMTHRDSYAWRHRLKLAAGWTGLMVFAGVVSHMKLTYNVVMLGCVGAMILTLITRASSASSAENSGVRRVRKVWLTAAWLLGVYVMTWMIAWVGMGQSLAHVPAYFKGARQIISSYGDAMGYPGPWWQGIELFVVVLAVFAAAVRMIIVRGLSPANRKASGRRLMLAFRITAATGLLFIAFKSAIVRQGDGHFSLVATVLTGISLLIASSFVNDFVRRRPGPSGGVTRRQSAIISGVLIALALAGCMTMNLVHSGGPVRYVSMALQVSRWHDMVTFLQHGDAHIRPLWQHEMSQVRQELPWGSYELTTDIYPTRLDLGVWSDYPLSLRPTLQSYVAANDTLLRMNANHLLGHDAPKQIILMQGETVDGQYPAFSDSLSWPVLLTQYDVTKLAGNAVILKRNTQPRQVSLISIGSQTIKMGEGALVPPVPQGAQGIWATMKLKPSKWGMLRGVFYKRPVLEMKMIFMDGSQQEARFMPLVSSAGFLLSPKIEFGPQWLPFATGGTGGAGISEAQAKAFLQRSTLKAIKIIPYKGVLDWPSYEQGIEVEYWGFAFEPQPMRIEAGR